MVTKQCCASFFDGGSEVFRKLRTTDSLKLNIKVRGRDQKLEAAGPKGPEAKARCYEADAEAETKILASRPVWPRGFNISGSILYHFRVF